MTHFYLHESFVLSFGIFLSCITRIHCNCDTIINKPKVTNIIIKQKCNESVDYERLTGGPWAAIVFLAVLACISSYWTVLLVHQRLLKDKYSRSFTVDIQDNEKAKDKDKNKDKNVSKDISSKAISVPSSSVASKQPSNM